MEIRNNLISKINIKSISKCRQVHNSKQEQYQPYKIISEIINKPHSEAITGFMNVLTNNQISLNEEELLTLADATKQYFDEQSKNTKGNNISVCVPIVEIINTRSNPKITVEIPSCIKYTSSTNYEISCGANVIDSIITKYAMVVRKVMGVPDNNRLNFAVFYRPGEGKTLIVRIQCLDILATKGAIVNMAKMLDIRHVKYVERYTEWYLCNFTPNDKKWSTKFVYSNDPGETEHLESLTPVELATFSTQYPNLPLVFSPNTHTNSGYKKEIRNSEFDNEIIVETNIESEKFKLFLENPFAQYYNLLLKYIPDVYKTDAVLWRELIKSFKRCKCEILFREFSANFAGEFDQRWNSKNNVEHVHIGYYHQLCNKYPKFTEELETFLCDLIEIHMYSSGFEVVDKDAAMIIGTLTNGLFYIAVSPDDKKHNIWWRYVSENDSSMKGEIYKWRSCNEPNDILMPVIYDQYHKLVSQVAKRMESAFEDGKYKKATQKKLTSYAKLIAGSLYPTRISRILAVRNKVIWFNKYHDKYPDILGTINGIVELNVAAGKPKIPPNFITGYSKYFITRHTVAKYRPFNRDDPSCKIWLDLYKQIIPEKDAREVIWYYLATGCDQACKILQVLHMIGFGSNGKSVIMDNVLYILGDLATKLSTNLLTSKPRGGAADPDYILMKNRNLGIITETDDGDKIISSRLKSIGEAQKNGRDLFQSSENFETNCTVLVGTNYALNMDDNDDGTWRRSFAYRMKFKFTKRPNPKYPNEKLVNRSYESLAKNNTLYADGLLSCLIHKRIKFHHKYNSEIEKVSMPTIDQYTEEYKIEQNRVEGFLYARLVLMYGYSPDGIMRDDVTKHEIVTYYEANETDFVEILSLDTIVEQYKEWYKNIGFLNKTNESLNQDFCKSKAGKLFSTDGRNYELQGYRLLQKGKKKLPNEIHYL